MTEPTGRPRGRPIKSHVETGQIFGYLTVIDRRIDNVGRTVWLCRCICGREVVAHASYLISGRTRSCGCRGALASRLGYRNPNGIFTVIKILPTIPKLFLCQCDCGNQFVVRSASTTQLSCGCLRGYPKRIRPDGLGNEPTKPPSIRQMRRRRRRETHQ